MRGRNLAELALDLDPDGHRVDANRLAAEARDEQVTAVLGLDEGPERVGNLEPPLVIDFGGVVSPKHSLLLHFAP